MAKKASEELLRIIELCREVEEKGIDPFQVDVPGYLRRLREYLSGWEGLEELLRDAEALNRLSRVVKLQENWVRRRSSMLYIDPMMVELKVKTLDREELARAFIKAHRPIVALNQLTPERLKEAAEYWRRLLPLEERLAYSFPEARETITSTSLRVSRGVEFQELVAELWGELRKKGRTSYWDFVTLPSFKETAERAFLTSFLVTWGYARLELDPLSGEAYLRAHKHPVSPLKQPGCRSLPLVINYSKWERLMEEKYGGEGSRDKGEN